MNLTPITADGHAIGITDDIYGALSVDDVIALSSALSRTARRGRSSRVDSATHNPIVMRLHLHRLQTSGFTQAQFDVAVKQWFNPYDAPETARVMTALGDDGSTVVRLTYYLTAREWASHSQYVATLEVEPLIESNTLTTSAANPVSVNNLGTADASAIVAVTTTNHATLRRCTVKGIGGGGGVVAQIILIDLLDALAVVNKIYAYVGGKSVAFSAVGAGGVNSAIYVAVDTAGDGVTTTAVDILYGSALPNNPLYDALDIGGLHNNRTLGVTASQLAWAADSWNCSQYPSRAGQWRPRRFGTAFALDSGQPESSGGSVYSDGANDAVVTLRAGQSPQYTPNNANAIVLDVGVKGTTLSNFRRITAGLDQMRAFVRYRKANSETWIDAWTSTVNATVSTAITVTDAVQIVAGLEYTGLAPAVSPATGTLTIDGSAVVTLSIPLAAQLTVVVGSAQTVDYIAGVVTIGAGTLTLATVASDGTTTINSNTDPIVSSSVGGAWIKHLSAPNWSDPERGLQIVPGVVATAHTLTLGSMVVSFRSAFG